MMIILYLIKVCADISCYKDKGTSEIWEWDTGMLNKNAESTIWKTYNRLDIVKTKIL